MLRHRPTINTTWINHSCCSPILPPRVPSVTGVRRSNIITGWWKQDLLGLYKHLLACIPRTRAAGEFDRANTLTAGAWCHVRLSNSVQCWLSVSSKSVSQRDGSIQQKKATTTTTTGGSVKDDCLDV